MACNQSAAFNGGSGKQKIFNFYRSHLTFYGGGATTQLPQTSCSALPACSETSGFFSLYIIITNVAATETSQPEIWSNQTHGSLASTFSKKLNWVSARGCKLRAKNAMFFGTLLVYLLICIINPVRLLHRSPGSKLKIQKCASCETYEKVMQVNPITGSAKHSLVFALHSPDGRKEWMPNSSLMLTNYQD